MVEAAAEQETDVGAGRYGTTMKRRVWLFRLAVVVAVAAMAWGLWYVIIGRNHVVTDNAYVNAELAQVTPLISATVIEVSVRDTQLVKRGDVLVKLDPASAEIAVAEAEAELAEARRQFRQAVAANQALAAKVQSRSADIASARARFDAAEADVEKARINLTRRQALADSGAVSGEELSDAREALAGAQAALSASRAGIALAQADQSSARGDFAASQAIIHGSTVETDPRVMAAKARLKDAKLDLGNTVMRAPIDGVVTRRQVQVGQRVERGKPVMVIVPVDKVFVDANFKENQLRRVKAGMPAKVTTDIYGGSVTYHGKVAGIAAGTGASMSLIPSQNATGNWIKVVQRLPVRIELDPRELVEHPLRVGLSTEVEIDISGN